MSSKSILNTGAEDPVLSQNTRVTRSNAKSGTLQASNPTPQLATLEKKKAKAKELEEEKMAACRTLVGKKFFSKGTEVTHQSITCALTLITQKHSQTAPQSLIKALQAVSTLMQEANNATNQVAPVLEMLTQKLGECVEHSLQQEMAKLSNSLKDSMADQCKAITPPKTMVEAIASLKQVASDMNKTIREATNATTQISDTAQLYKQALLQVAPQGPPVQHPYHACERNMQTDLRILVVTLELSVTRLGQREMTR